MGNPKATIVVLNDGETFTSIEGCKVVHILDDAVLDEMEAGDYREPEVEGAVESIRIGDLLRVAECAEAVLDSEFGVKSVSELAAALERAGFGTWTLDYPAIEEAPNG